jgi:hypothetical protein
MKWPGIRVSSVLALAILVGPGSGVGAEVPSVARTGPSETIYMAAPLENMTSGRTSSRSSTSSISKRKLEVSGALSSHGDAVWKRWLRRSATVAACALNGMDAYSTYSAFARHPGRVREVNPILRNADGGLSVPKLIAFKGGSCAVSVFGPVLLPNRDLMWGTINGALAVHTGVVVRHNLGVLSDLDRAEAARRARAITGPGMTAEK